MSPRGVVYGFLFAIPVWAAIGLTAYLLAH